MTEKHLTNQQFTELSLEASLLQGLADAGFKYCTPIQADALPPALDGKDVAGQAQTGTGKTAAFLLATFNHLLINPPSPDRASDQPRALILAPTRELAIQIYNDAKVLGGHTNLKLGLAYGGTGYESQRNTILGGIDILIGTPGRLIDYYKQGVYNLNDIQVTVMDEADRMFDLGFINDVRYMLRRMPPAADRLNMLFSATLSYRVNELAYEHMNDPQVIKIDAEKLVVDQVEERAYYPATDEKITLLINLLSSAEHVRTLVFVNTKHAAERVSNWLQANDIPSAVLSGDVPQRMRERLLKEFTEGTRDVLVATDVAARGLHIPEVSHVINFDLPQDAEDYVHRIGRTARAGASGEAISFICERYAYSIMEIEDYIGHSLPKAEITPELLEKVVYPTRQTPASPSRGRGKGRERSPSRGRSRRSGDQAAEHRKDSATPPRKAAVAAVPIAEAEVPTTEDGVAPTSAMVEAEAPPVASEGTTATTGEEANSAISTTDLEVVNAPAMAETEAQPVAAKTTTTPASTEADSEAQPAAADLQPKPVANREFDNPKPEPAPPPPVPRFSRRFGEVPVIG